jgi:hypothetical protein
MNPTVKALSVGFIYPLGKLFFKPVWLRLGRVVLVMQNRGSSIEQDACATVLTTAQVSRLAIRSSMNSNKGEKS